MVKEILAETAVGFQHCKKCLSYSVMSCFPAQIGKQGKFIYIAHFIHSGNSKCFTEQKIFIYFFKVFIRNIKFYIKYEGHKMTIITNNKCQHKWIKNLYIL